MVAADKLHNVREVLRSYRVHGDALLSHFKGRQEGTVWYYHAVIGALRNAERPEEQQLNAIIAEIDYTLSRLEQAIAEKSVEVSPAELV